ncbi:MAG: SdrD B-like domain-containing protein, partial [Methylococcaceae bacterium]
MSTQTSGTIGNLIWNDVNRNGLQDAGEAGVSGVTIQLKNTAGEVVQTTKTNDIGSYSFSAVAGTYSMTIVTPSGYALTTPDASSNSKDTLDSDFSNDFNGTSSTAPFTVTSSQVNNNLDGGLVRVATTGNVDIGDCIWDDTNGDGIQNGSEVGLAGVTVKLIDLNGTVLQGVLSDAAGAYSFNAPAGTYRIGIDIPAGYVISAKNQGSDVTKDSDANPATGQTANISYTASTHDTDIGLHRTTPAPINPPVITISNDSNNDGIINAAELAGSVWIPVDIALPADAKAGYVLTLNDGYADYPFTLTAANITAGHFITSVYRAAEGQSVNVSAYLSNPATGAISTTSNDSAIIDTTAPSAPTVTITTDANNDGSISSAELGAATTIAIRVGLPAGAKVGDTITLTNGTNPVQSHTLTAADITATLWNTSVPKPANGSTLSVGATLSDPAGNVSAPATDSAVLNTGSTLPPQVITTSNDSNTDGIINAAELDGSVWIPVDIALPADAKVGYVLTLNDGYADYPFTLTASHISAGHFITSVYRAAEGQSVNVSAYLSNPATGAISTTSND